MIPIAVFFQAYSIWINGKVEGLSPVTWSLLLFASLTMMIYALHHRIKPLILTYVPLVLANAIVVAGILLV